MERRTFLGLGGIFLGSLLVPKALVEAVGTPEVYRRKALGLSELISNVKFRGPFDRGPFGTIDAWILPQRRFVLKVPGQFPRSFHHDPSWTSFGIYQQTTGPDVRDGWYWDQMTKYLRELVEFYDELVPA